MDLSGLSVSQLLKLKTELEKLLKDKGVRPCYIRNKGASYFLKWRGNCYPDVPVFTGQKSEAFTFQSQDSAYEALLHNSFAFHGYYIEPIEKYR